MARGSGKAGWLVGGLGFGVAAGVLLGTLVIAPNMPEGSGPSAGVPTEKLAAAETRADIAEAQAASSDSVVGELAAAAVEGALADRPVLVVRTADAAGVDAVVAADPVTDWGNPNTVRASKGTVFSVPVASDPTAVTLGWLRAHGIPLVAATPDTEVTHTEVDYRGPVAIAVGAEKTGLTQEVLAAAQHRVRIPMVGLANSLNVATSAAVLVYEAVRQRSFAQRP